MTDQTQSQRRDDSLLTAREFFLWAKDFEESQSRKRHDQANTFQSALLKQDERWEKHSDQQHTTILELIRQGGEDRRAMQTELLRIERVGSSTAQQHEPRLTKVEKRVEEFEDIVQQLRGALGLLRLIPVGLLVTIVLAVVALAKAFLG